MICDYSKWWLLLTYYGFKSHVIVTDDLDFFAEERIKVGKEKAGTSALNQVYDKFQVNQYKTQTRQLMELVQQKVHGCINQCQLIMIISTVIQNIPDKFWTD